MYFMNNMYACVHLWKFIQLCLFTWHSMSLESHMHIQAREDLTRRAKPKHMVQSGIGTHVRQMFSWILRCFGCPNVLGDDKIGKPADFHRVFVSVSCQFKRNVVEKNSAFIEEKTNINLHGCHGPRKLSNSFKPITTTMKTITLPGINYVHESSRDTCFPRKHAKKNGNRTGIFPKKYAKIFY